jgi:arylsulfatase A-like enzyme
MKRALALLAWYLAAEIGFAISAGRAAAAEPARPNFVLLMADDQGFGDVAYNGNPHVKTPVLDEISRTALRLDRFYAAAPVCSPTRGSVLTGRHPNRFGCFSWGHDLRPQEVTLAESLSASGYATGHFGKWHLGLLAADSAVSPGKSGFDKWFSSPNFFENSPLMCADGKVVQTEGEGSQVTVDAALSFIRASAAASRPFLAVVWFGSPHGPHQALEEDKQLYSDQPPELANYWGEITAMDRAVGNLRNELRRLGIAENTLVWYTSDNGATGPGSTGGLRGKKASLWEGGLRVPGIIEWPARVKSPRQSSIPCCSVDIYPTLLKLAGITMPPNQPPLDGISLAPLLEGKMERRLRPLGFWVHPTPGKGVNSTAVLRALARGESPAPIPQTPPAFSETEFPGPAAWLDGNWKLHRLGGAGPPRYALYDLAADPQEATNVAADNADRVAKMTEQLAAWQVSVARSLNGKDYRP